MHRQGEPEGRIAWTRAELAQRAKRRALEVGDYWHRAEQFIRSPGETPKEQLTLRQRNWLTALELDLKEVGDSE